MTSPNERTMSEPRYVRGAIDLGELTTRAQQKEASDGQKVARFAQLTPQSFEQELIVRSTQIPVVLLLGSQRSPACEDMRSILERVATAQESTEWVGRYVDVDTHGEIAHALQVHAVPTMVAVAAGRPLTQTEGAQPQDQMVQWISAILQATAGKLAGLPDDEPTAAHEDPRLLQAAEAMEAEDYSAAIAVYDSILQAEPAHVEARAARAQAVLMQRMQLGTADRADQLVMAGNKVEAFDYLIGEMAGSSGQKRDDAKARLLELFSLFDTADPEVIAARTRMASALF